MREHFAAAETIFTEDDANRGVFLIVKGKVCLKVLNLPKLDRIFGLGALLGLPSTFTGRPYSLTAVALTESDVIRVDPGVFLDVMRERPELCREATEILGREVTFIQSALAEKRRQASLKKTPGDMVSAAS